MLSIRRLRLRCRLLALQRSASAFAAFKRRKGRFELACGGASVKAIFDKMYFKYILRLQCFEQDVSLLSELAVSHENKGALR